MSALGIASANQFPDICNELNRWGQQYDTTTDIQLQVRSLDHNTILNATVALGCVALLRKMEDKSFFHCVPTAIFSTGALLGSAKS